MPEDWAWHTVRQKMEIICGKTVALSRIFRKMAWVCFLFLYFFLVCSEMSGYCHTGISHLNMAAPGTREHYEVQYLEVGLRSSCFFRAYFPPYNRA